MLTISKGPKYGYIWFGSNIIILVFVFFLVPETKDRTLEEIDEMFEEKVGARKFKGYKCTRTEDARAIGMHVLDDKRGDQVPTHVESI